MSGLVEKLSETIKFIRDHTNIKPKIGLILGSGLGGLTKQIQIGFEASYSEIPNFVSTTIEGHSGKLIFGNMGDVEVVALQGRVHTYEGYDLAQVVFPTQLLCMLGIEALVVTNAAGSLNEKMRPGDLMVIDDHINLMGSNPLRGRNADQLGPRFPDLTEAYDKNIRQTVRECAEDSKLNVHSGIYIAVPGPTYETPAEVRYLKMIGGDAVGMSTVPEVIAANHLGVRVGGISCLTNMAAGISKTKLNHKEVTNIAQSIEHEFQLLMKNVIVRLGEGGRK